MGAVWLVAQTKAFDRLAVLKEVIDYFDPGDTAERQKALDRFEAEARTLGDLKHPGIPDLYAYFSEGGHNYLVMEYIEGPDLRKGLTREDGDTGELVPGGPLPPDAVLRHTVEIAAVLEYLASCKPPVVHNDIKPGNIIIDQHSGRAVLVDFGTARARYLQAAGTPDGDRAEIYGTIGYAAPELFHGRSEPRSDIYSLAATAYHLLTDDDPRDHPMQYPLLDTLPAALRELLQQALSHDIDDRPEATGFRQQLERYLAGMTGPLRALTFPDGDAADDRDELLRLAVRHWNFAAGILHDGTLAHWLRRTLHDPVAAQAAEATVGRWPNSPDAALDEFVRTLAPSILPPGELELRTSSIRLTAAGANQQIARSVEIANRGRGYLRGEVYSTQPWVTVGSGAFACPPGRTCSVPIEIDTTGLVAGQSYVAAVTLTPVNGTPEVVAVQVNVTGEPTAAARISATSPAIDVAPQTIDFGTVPSQDLSAGPRQLEVVNRGQTTAQVHVRGAPRWLLVKPEHLRLAAGARQIVKLTARIDKVRGREQQAKLSFAVDGGQDHQVAVKVRVKRRRWLW
jgi:tRNA A-37 threonylcarbamoyl transferase component Bud32